MTVNELISLKFYHRILATVQNLPLALIFIKMGFQLHYEKQICRRY